MTFGVLQRRKSRVHNTWSWNLVALYPLLPLISKCHITIWTRRWHDAGPPPQDAGPTSRQLQQARHSVGPIIVPSEYSPHQCFGVPCWYNAGPPSPSPDAGPASHQRLCERPAMPPVLWPVSNNYWPLCPANRTTALVQCRANAISSHYTQDVGPPLGQCLQLVS